MAWVVNGINSLVARATGSAPQENLTEDIDMAEASPNPPVVAPAAGTVPATVMSVSVSKAGMPQQQLSKAAAQGDAEMDCDPALPQVTPAAMPMVSEPRSRRQHTKRAAAVAARARLVALADGGRAASGSRHSSAAASSSEQQAGEFDSLEDVPMSIEIEIDLNPQPAAPGTSPPAEPSTSSLTAAASSKEKQPRKQPVRARRDDKMAPQPFPAAALTHQRKTRRAAAAAVTAAASPLPLQASSPAGLGASLMDHDVLHKREDALGKKSGQWVEDTTLINVLDAVCSEEAAEFTYKQDRFELRTCYLDSITGEVDIPDLEMVGPPSTPQLILGVYTLSEQEGVHFMCMVINPCFKVVHAFDTLGSDTDAGVMKRVKGLYPNLDLFGKHKYTVRNHTGKISQAGASCGPWSLWICVAYAFNFGGCRDPLTDDMDLGKINCNPIDFWRAVTC